MSEEIYELEDVGEEEYRKLLPSRREFFDELFELMYPLEEERQKVYAEF